MEGGTDKEVAMNLKGVFWVKLFVLLLILILSSIGSAFSQGKRVVRAGEIEWVSRDFKYIGINEGKVKITPQTKIVDSQGNSLKVSELKPGRHVTVELIRNADGSWEKRIVIRR
jgi:hypothetical protein